MTATEAELDQFPEEEEFDNIHRRVRLVLHDAAGERCFQVGPTIEGPWNLRPILEIYRTLDSALRESNTGLFVNMEFWCAHYRTSNPREASL